MTSQNDHPWWDPDTPSDPPSQPSNQDPYSSQNDTAPRRLEIRPMITHWIHHNIYTTIYMLIGLALALAILCIGFGRTLLIAIFLGGGYLLGSWHDGNPHLKARIARFRARWIDDNPFMK